MNGQLDLNEIFQGGHIPVWLEAFVEDQQFLM